MQAPAFYEAQGIPKVRWMYPGKCYYARLMTVPLKYAEARLYIYVLNEQHVIAFRNEEMTDEIGMLQLESFLKLGEMDHAVPDYRSVSPISLKYDMLHLLLTKEHRLITETPKKITEVAQKITEDAPVTVRISSPEPKVEYRQLKMF